MTSPDSFDPEIGVPEEIGPGLRRIVAPNPSPMTFRGTNTYLLGRHALAVIDPGPDNADHLEAILSAIRPGQSISHILVTHAHRDHSPLARALSQETGAPVLAYGDATAGRSEIMQTLAATGLVAGGEGVDQSFQPDICLADGAEVTGEDWSLTGHWTPGHFGNHMSFASDNIVFVGDLIMEWASSLVSPPDGDLTDFMASCRFVKALNPQILHAGHGAPITDPFARIDWLLAHRLSREAEIRDALRAGPATAAELTAQIYTQTPKALHKAAERNVLAHLIDLHQRQITAPIGPLTAQAPFRIL